MDRVIDRGRATLDVARLPTVVFGFKTLMTWGVLAFMVIEGWTLALVVMSYFYLRQSTTHWPPLRTPHPSLVIPTINLVVMLVSLAAAWWTAKRAEKLDRGGVTTGLIASSIFGIVILVLRWFEFWSINTRWDTTAYGSAAWLLVGFHATLILMDVGDTIGLNVMFLKRELPAHFYPDTTDNSMYWFFTVLAWIPIYIIVYVGPYFL
jgi:cytochrome c oxidase subunit III